MAKKLENLSKTLAHALRHEPWLYEIELDEEGWADVPAILAALRREWPGLQESDLAAMIAQSSKQRYELAGGRIRAFYGHSLPGQLRKTPAEPPALLFHGTSPEATVETITFGTPTGKLCIAGVASAVAPDPPAEMSPARSPRVFTNAENASAIAVTAEPRSPVKTDGAPSR